MDIWKRIDKTRVHPDLASVMDHAASRIARAHAGLTFVITEGDRTPERQKELVRIGASRTLNSRHIGARQTSRKAEAVDVVVLHNGKVSWHGPLYERLANTIKESAEQLSIPVTWGGDWKSFYDGPHYELTKPPKLPKVTKA